jgi:hypothetical protein
MLSNYYCESHNTKYYKNEKTKDNGQLSVWYSHKKSDGTGFCVMPEQQSLFKDDAVATTKSQKLETYQGINGMYVCNAMNNAVSLASNGVIGVGEIGNYFNRILSELSKVA